MMDMYIQGTKKTFISGRYDYESGIISSTKNFKHSKFKIFDYSKYLTKSDKFYLKIFKKNFGLYKLLENFYKSIKDRSNPFINIDEAFLWSSIVELSKRSILKKKQIKIKNPNF